MTTNNDTEKTIGLLILDSKYGTTVIPFEGEEGRARAYLSVLREREEIGWYGPRPDEISDPTPEKHLSPEELRYFNLTDNELESSEFHLPKSILEDMKKKRDKARAKYSDIALDVKEENWFWKSLIQVLDSNEDEAIKLGETLGNGRFRPLVCTILQSRRDWEYEGYEEQLRTKLFT